MAGRIPGAVLTLLLAAAAGAEEPRGLLASYDFEDEGRLATGPDTFAVFQHAHGTVALTTTFQRSGARAVELRDVKGDRDFPEIQGYLPLRRQGRLFTHFAFLTAEPAEELNFALAGPAWFSVARDGIAVWLKTEEGVLRHVSDGIPKRLFAVEPFVWYAVEIDYDVTAGRYALTVRRDGEREPLVALRGQPNAANAPGSAVDKFSFVGDPFGDASSVVYYVDDVVIGVDESVREHPFVAPGRRKLFVDAFVEHQGRLRARPQCLPLLTPADVGLGAEDMAAFLREGLLEVLQALLDGQERPWRERLGESAAARRFEALGEWAEGCAALRGGRAGRALPHFRRAEELAPAGELYTLSSALALTALKRFEEADARLASLSSPWRDDARYAAAAGWLGTARGDLPGAEEWLRRPEAALAEQYYFVLLWSRKGAEARDFALRLAAASRGPAAAAWTERAGDAAFFLRDLPEARSLYEQARRQGASERALLLKLADVAWLARDPETERALREKVYGTLRQR